VSATPPIVRDVRIANVTIDGAKTAGEIIGLPEMPITSVLLENVDIKAQRGLTVQDAKAVEFRAVRVTPQQGDPFIITHAEVKGFTAENARPR
jgi:hypothetical protein